MNKLYFADNLDVLKEFYCNNKGGFIDLVYIDPPFNSKRNYNILFEDLDPDTKAQKQAFADTWSNVSYQDTLKEIQELDLDLHKFLTTLDTIRISKGAISYLTTMAIRIYYIHKVLKDTGSFYLHCDPTMSHYLKIICDLIFKEKNFRNEIIWCYAGGGIPKNDFPRKHEIIFRYTKTDNYFFNPPLRKYSSTGSGIHSDGTKYDKEKDRTPYNDWWIDITPLNTMSKDNLGYDTQKPDKLLDRIIKASSNEVDLVADFFCGCGTTIASAQKLNRKWIGIDISHLAIGLIEKRLRKSYGKTIKDSYEVFGFPKDLASAKELANKTEGGRLKFQDWVIEIKIGGISNPQKTADGGWDGHLTFKTPKSKEFVLIEVKSGHCNIKNVREFIQVVIKRNASIGAFICFGEYLTKPMLLEAKQQGQYKSGAVSFPYDKIQIITVEDLLEGKNISMPQSTEETFKSGKRINTTEINQKNLYKR